MSSEVEETMKRIQSHRGVKGVLIVNSDGVPIRSNLPSNETDTYAALVSQLALKASSVVRTLDETDELLGEILPSDEDLLDIDDSDEVVLAEVTPSEKNEEADIEVESFEDLELDTLEEESLELEEISEEPDLEPVEELELDIEGGIPDIEEGAVELSEVGLDDAEDEIVSELSGVDIGGMTEELIQEVDLEELGEDLEELDEDLEELGQDLSEELGADLEALDETEDLPSVSSASSGPGNIPESLKLELKSVLGYMDHLLESLPEEKIQEFAQSEHFEVYKKLFEELGLES